MEKWKNNFLKTRRIERIETYLSKKNDEYWTLSRLVERITSNPKFYIPSTRKNSPEFSSK